MHVYSYIFIFGDQQPWTQTTSKIGGKLNQNKAIGIIILRNNNDNSNNKWHNDNNNKGNSEKKKENMNFRKDEEKEMFLFQRI